MNQVIPKVTFSQFSIDNSNTNLHNNNHDKKHDIEVEDDFEVSHEIENGQTQYQNGT